MAIAPSSTTNTASYRSRMADPGPTGLTTPLTTPLQSQTPTPTATNTAVGVGVGDIVNEIHQGHIKNRGALTYDLSKFSAADQALIDQAIARESGHIVDDDEVVKPKEEDTVPLGFGALETGAGVVAGAKALSLFKRSLALRGLMAIRRALRGERPATEKPVERAGKRPGEEKPAGEKPVGEKPVAEMTEAERAEKAAADLRAGNATRTDLEASAAGGRVVNPVAETGEALDAARAARTLETVGEIRAASSLTRLMKIGGPIALISFAIPTAVYASVKGVAPAGVDPAKVDAAAGYAARYAGFSDEDAREQWRLGNHGTAILKEGGKLISDTAGFLKRVVTEPAKAWADTKQFGTDMADLGSKLWNNPRGVAQSLYAMGVAASDDALKRQAIDVASTAGNGTRPDVLATGQNVLTTAQNNPELVRATQTARAAWAPPADHNVNYRGTLTPPAANPGPARVAGVVPAPDSHPSV